MYGRKGSAAKELAAEINDEKLDQADKSHYKNKGLVACNTVQNVGLFAAGVEGVEYAAKDKHCKKSSKEIGVSPRKQRPCKGAF